MTGVMFAMPAMTGITNALPDIPRVYTGICEWLACMVYIAVLYRRASPRRTTIAAMTGLVLLIAVQYFDGMLPIWFWIVGMTLAFGCMYATILFGAGAGKRESLYITARAFVLGELVASLHWQIVTFAGMRDNTLDFDWRSILSLTGTYAICFGLAWLVERGNFSQTAPTLPTTSAAIATVAITVVTPGGLLYPHFGGFLRFCDSVCATGAGTAHRGEHGARIDQRAAGKPASGVSAVQGKYRIVGPSCA